MTCTTAKNPWPAHRPPHLEPNLVAVLVLVPHRLGSLAIERLRQQDARDAQRLLRDARQLGQRLLGLACDPRSDLPHAALHEHEDRHQDHGDEGQAPVDQDHRHQRGDHRDGVAEHARDGVRQHARHPADIVLQPRLYDSGLGAGEEAELHRLQVLEQPHAKVARHLVADGGGEPGLHDPEHRRQQEQSDRDAHQHREQRDVRAASVEREERVVEDALHQQRRDHGEAGAHDDEQRGECESPAVGTEQRYHPTTETRHLRCRRIEASLRRLVDAAERSAAACAATHAHDFRLVRAARGNTAATTGVRMDG